MRRFLTLVLTALWLSGTAHAGTLTSATWVGDFLGAPFTLVTSGVSLTASGSAAGTAINMVSLTVAPLTLGHLLTPFSRSTAPTFLSLTLGGSQTINPANAANQGIAGAARVILGNDSDGTALYTVPLSAGVAGQATTTNVVPGLNIPVEVTATFFPWTTGSQTFTGLTVSGVAAPDVTISGTNSLSGGAGSITLVSPTRTRVCVAAIFGSFPCVAGAAGNTQSSISATATRLTLNFAVPEPGTFLLFAAGLVALSARRREGIQRLRSLDFQS